MSRGSERKLRARVDDPYDLGRFIEAQQPLYARVCAELAGGHKRSHWIWFIFPQLAGLGSSAMAQRYALGSLDEARAYLAHELLGRRLRECTELVNGIERRSIEAIFGYPDHLKFRSCMTLFARAADTAHAARPFRAALAQYFAGAEDPRTVERLTSSAS
jgi:uncharacterized protein (DUF1810 family)